MWGNWTEQSTRGHLRKYGALWLYVLACLVAIGLVNAFLQTSGTPLLLLSVTIAGILGIAFQPIFRQMR